MTDSEKLRLYLGEAIPTGGTAADTFFTDLQITDLLAEASTIYESAAIGWEMKAATYADMVNVSESGTSRNMSDLYAHATDMIHYYRKRGKRPKLVQIERRT